MVEVEPAGDPPTGPNARRPNDVESLELERGSRLHIVDLEASRSGRPVETEVVRRLAKLRPQARLILFLSRDVIDRVTSNRRRDRSRRMWAQLPSR